MLELGASSRLEQAQGHGGLPAGPKQRTWAQHAMVEHSPRLEVRQHSNESAVLMDIRDPLHSNGFTHGLPVLVCSATC